MPKFQVESANTVVDNAHHGTDLAKADGIVAGGEFRVSRGGNHWLGDGIYFFQGSVRMAVFFAKQKATAMRVENWAVLRASVLLERCLDLTTQRYRRELDKWIELLKARHERLHLTRAWIINSFARKGCGGFDTVRCKFPPGLPQDSSFGFSFSKRPHVQIAVLKVANISNVTCVRKGKR